MDGERDDFVSVPLRSAFWATARTALLPSAVLLAKSLNPITGTWSLREALTREESGHRAKFCDDLDLILEWSHFNCSRLCPAGWAPNGCVAEPGSRGEGLGALQGLGQQVGTSVGGGTPVPRPLREDSGRCTGSSLGPACLSLR